MADIKRTINEINPMFLVSIGFVGVVYFMMSSQGPVSGDIQYVMVGTLVLLALLAFRTKSRRLIEIRDAQKVAFNDAKLSQNRGEIREDGKLVLLEDGVIRRVNNEPDSINVDSLVVVDVFRRL